MKTQGGVVVETKVWNRICTKEKEGEVSCSIFDPLRLRNFSPRVRAKNALGGTIRNRNAFPDPSASEQQRVRTAW